MKLALALLLLTPAVALAQGSPSRTDSVRLDPARTTIRFTAGGLRRVHGSFELKGGLFAIDSTSGIAQGEILVDASTERSDNAKLDAKIKGETLEAGKYPGIFFHPEKVAGALPAHDGAATLKLEGTFNIHGADHPLTVEVRAVRAGGDYTFSTSFAAPYVQWGMRDASTFLTRDKTIHIMIESHGTVEDLKPKS